MSSCLEIGFLCVCYDALHPSPQFFSHVGFPSSCVEPVLSVGEELCKLYTSVLILIILFLI